MTDAVWLVSIRCRPEPLRVRCSGEHLRRLPSFAEQAHMLRGDLGHAGLDRAKHPQEQMLVRWSRLTFDAGYGMHSDFMTALDARGVDYVGEVPAHLTGWAKAPPVMHKEHISRSPIGHPRMFPRVKIRPDNPSQRVYPLPVGMP
jgi:hypothetical protein